MNSSGFYAFNALPENTAIGYVHTDDGYISNIYKLPIRGASDGGMYTNARDLDNFWNCLFSGKVISKENLFKLTNQEATDNKLSDYGMGVYQSKFLEHKCFSSSGVDAGVGFISEYMPDVKTIINVMSNRTNGKKEILDFIKKEGKKVIL